jgi:hypothetical protein
MTSGSADYKLKTMEKLSVTVRESNNWYDIVGVIVRAGQSRSPYYNAHDNWYEARLLCGNKGAIVGNW